MTIPAPSRLLQGADPDWQATAASHGPFAMASLLLLYVAVYLKDVLAPWIGNGAVQLLLALALLCGFGAVIACQVREPRFIMPGATLLSLALLGWLLTLGVTGSPTPSSYYIAIPCGVLAANLRGPLLRRLLLFHLVATIIIQSFEYATSRYLFVYQASDGTELNETLFGGSQGVFRAKGLFQGPLSAVAFALWTAFLLDSRLMSTAALLLCAFLASGRLGLLVGTFLMAFRLRSGSGTRSARSTVMGLAAVGMIVTLFVLSAENRTEFILSALDINNDQNTSRVYFWLSSLGYFMGYSPTRMLFGDFGFIANIEGGTENDFLRLLLDCGFVGLALYVGALLHLAILAYRRRSATEAVTLALIIALMNLFPFVQSLSSALLFWVYYLNRTRPRTAVASAITPSAPSGSAAASWPASTGQILPPSPTTEREQHPGPPT